MREKMILVLVVMLVSLNVYAGEVVIPNAPKKAQDSVLKMTLGYGEESIEAPAPGILLAGGFIVMPFFQSLLAADSIYANIEGESIPCLPLGIDNGVVLLMPSRVPNGSGVNFPQPTGPKGEAFYLVKVGKVTRMPISAEQDIDTKSIFGGMIVDNYGAFYGIAVNIATGGGIKNVDIILFPIIAALLDEIYEAAKKLNEKSGKEQIRIRSI